MNSLCVNFMHFSWRIHKNPLLCQLVLNVSYLAQKLSVLFTDHTVSTHFPPFILISTLKCTHTNDNESHAIEPGAQICQTPQQYSKFDWVYQILNQEEPSQFQSCCIHMGHSDVRHFSHLVLWQCQVQLQDVPSVNTSTSSEQAHNLPFY